LPQDVTDEDGESDEDGDGEPGEGEDEADEFEEVEYEGKNYKLPKELKEALLRQSDYTRKTQAASERQRELDEREQRITQQAEASEEELTARATYTSAQKELERFKDVNWREWHQQDPMACHDAELYVKGLNEQMQNAVQTVNTRQHERTQQAQQDFAKRVEESERWAAKSIKGWSPKVVEDLKGFMSEKGITAEAVQTNMSPKFLELMYLASLGNKALTQATTPKPKPVAAKPIQPLTRVQSKSAPGPKKTLADLASGDLDAYAAARRKGIGG